MAFIPAWTKVAIVSRLDGSMPARRRLPGDGQIGRNWLKKFGRYISPARDSLPGRIGGYPGGGAYAAFAFNVGYARAMMQAALTV